MRKLFLATPAGTQLFTAAAAGEASASVELLAAGEGEVFFPAAWVGNGKQMTTVAKNAAIITKLLCFMCR